MTKAEQVSIIIPVIRPEKARRCVDAACYHPGIPSTDFEVLTIEDTEGIGCPGMVKKMVEMTKHDLVMFLGDDTIPQPGYLKAALDEMKKLPDGWGVVGLNSTGQNRVAHWLAHKKMLDLLGGEFFSTEYQHCWCDNELMDIAKEHRRWAFSEDSIIKHDHFLFTKEQPDDGYKKAYSREAQEHDQKTYWRRKRARMQKKYGTKLAIAVPLTDDKVYSHFLFSFTKTIINYLLGLFKSGKSISWDFLTPNYPGQIDAIRNDLVLQALYLGCTHILMMDTDQIYSTEDMVEKLLSHDLSVVGAKVHRRYPPFDPLLLRGGTGNLESIPDDEIEAAELIEVDATGCGCILYDTSVFIEMARPWFQLRTGDKGQPIGEDIGFCEKLKEAGHKIYVDCSIDVKHLSLLAVDWGTHKLYKKLKGVS